MVWQKGQRWLLAMLVALMTTLTPACMSRAERQQVETELAVFMRDYIVEQIRGVQIEHPDSTAAKVPVIIIWAPPGRNPDSPTEFADRYRPIRVWLFEKGQLSEQSDMLAAIEEYQQTYMRYLEVESWALYDFAIESISRDGQQAVVYVGALCGAMCGHGTRYMLQRGAAGEWEITGSEWVWLV
jgi:hypothetical protein